MRLYEINPIAENAIVLESPARVNSIQTENLDNKETNKNLAEWYLSRVHNKMPPSVSKSGTAGDYVLIETTKSETDRSPCVICVDTIIPRIVYYGFYEEIKDYESGMDAVIPQFVWVYKNDYPWGIVRDVFFNYYIKKWPIVISDTTMTDAGNSNFVKYMNDSHKMGLYVGFSDDGEITWFDDTIKMSLEDWLHKKKTFGPNKSNIVYMISKVKFY